MANLSITQAWNETAAFVGREARLLFPVAFLLVALPGAVMQLMMPQMIPGQPIEPGPWLLVLPVAVVAGMVGNIAIAFLALRPGTSVGEALQVGLRRFLPLLGAALLIGLAVAIAAMPLVLVAGIGVAGGGREALEGAAALIIIVLTLAFLFVWVRLLPMTPVAAVESAGPIGIIKRAWTLTSGHFWRLLGFILLLVIVALVIILALSTIFGILLTVIVGSPMEPGTTAAYVMAAFSALLQSVFVMVVTTFVARIYTQLAADRPIAA